MKKISNYIKEALKNPKYVVLYNGKEVKRFAFYRQAKHFAEKHNGSLFEKVCCEVVNTVTAEIL